MPSNEKILCIIPARGGSKSIPYKNIILLNKKPLIFYTIQQSLRIKEITKIIVSSDSQKIISKIQKFEKYKKFQIIKRPKKYATAKSTTEDVISHTLQLLKIKNFIPDKILLLEPTSPLRKDITVKKFIRCMSNKKFKSFLSVKEISHVPAIIDYKNRFNFLLKNQPRRRQDRKKLYCEGGSMYGINYETFINKKTILVQHIFPFIINKLESFDINEPEDIVIVDSLLKNKKKSW